MSFQTTSRHYRLQELGEGVFAAFARDGGAAISNAGVVNLGGSTLVVDTFLTPTAAEDLREDAARLTGQYPRLVVNTHYHNDHIWGNQAFLPEAELISTMQTRTLIQTAGQEEYNEYKAMTNQRLKELLAQQATAESQAQRDALGLWIGYFGGLQKDFPRLRVALPNLLFEERLGLHGSRRHAEVIAFTGAHTGSDAVVYLPEDGILFMSDLLFTGFHPYLGDGNPERWLEVLGAILDGSAGIHRVNCFVPGHGPVGTAADMQRLVDYIRVCQEMARRLVEQGKDSEAEIKAVPIPGAYADWTMERFFYANLRFLVERYKAGNWQIEELDKGK